MSPFMQDLFEDLAIPDVMWQPDWLSPVLAQKLYVQLMAEVSWKQDAMNIGEKSIPLPRLTAWQGDVGAEYVYSGILNNPEPWSVSIFDVKEKLEKELGIQFNSVLLNRYRNGHDSIGWHADDEPELGLSPIIASLSLGATRTFEIRRNPVKGTKPLTHSLPLTAGGLLVMFGNAQQSWKHQVPKEPHVLGERLNLTFRYIHPKVDD